MSKKSNSKLLVLGAGAWAAYYLWKKDKSSSNSTTNNVVDTGTETATDADLNNFIPIDIEDSTKFSSQDINSDKNKVTSATNQTATDTTEERDRRKTDFYFGDKTKPYDSFYDYNDDPVVTSNFTLALNSSTLDYLRVRISYLRFFVCDKYLLRKYNPDVIPAKRAYSSTYVNAVSPLIQLEFINPSPLDLRINDILLDSLKINDKQFDANYFANYFNEMLKYRYPKDLKTISDMWLTKQLNNSVEENNYKSTNKFLKGTSIQFPFTIKSKKVVKYYYMWGPLQGWNMFDNQTPKTTKSLSILYPQGFYFNATDESKTISFLQGNIQKLFLKINLVSPDDKESNNFIPSWHTITVNNVDSHANNAVNDTQNITEYLPNTDFTPIMNLNDVYTELNKEKDLGTKTINRVVDLMNN